MSKTDKKLLLYHSYIDVNNTENRNHLKTAWNHTPEDHNLDTQCHQNITYHTFNDASSAAQVTYEIYNII